MDVLDEIKRTEQIVQSFLDKMDSVSRVCCSHLESLKVAKKKDRGKIEDELKKFVDSLRTKRDETEKPKTDRNNLEIRQNVEPHVEHTDASHTKDAETPPQPNPSQANSHSKRQKNHLRMDKNPPKPKPREKHSHTKTHNGKLKFRDSHSKLESPDEYSDDEFLCGPVSQKPKKPVCLSIKKPAKNRSKFAQRIRLLDSIQDEDLEVWETRNNLGDTREITGNHDQTRISVSWTIKIKESSAQHTKQVKISGSDQVHLETQRHGKTLNEFRQSYIQEDEDDQRRPERHEISIAKEIEDGENILKIGELSNDTGLCEFSCNDNIRCGFSIFQECRVVVRKLSTSHKIFQPKVVLRKLTDAEIRKICGPFQERAEDGRKLQSPAASTPVEPSVGQTVRYTSLILEPARKFPRMFSTVKMRCSIMKMVLNPPQVVSKSKTKKPKEEPTSNNEMVKSMFKTKSKCIQEWRSRGRTKEVGKHECNHRKSLDLWKNQERHLGTFPIDRASTVTANKHKQEINRCIQGVRYKSRTKDIQGKFYSDIKCEGTTVSDKPKYDVKIGTKSELRPTNYVVGEWDSIISNALSKQASEGLQKPGSIEIDENLFPRDTAQKSRYPANKPNESKANNKEVDKKSSGSHYSTFNQKKPEESSKVLPDNSDGLATQRQPAKKEPGDSKVSTEEGLQTFTPPSNKSPGTGVSENMIPRKDQTSYATVKKMVKISPKKMVLITPTRLKYCVKTRSKTVQNPLIQNGRVTRSRIKIEHSQTNSASRSKNGEMFPGSQLTFLIESFRR